MAQKSRNFFDGDTKIVGAINEQTGVLKQILRALHRGLSTAQEREVRDGLAAHVDKLKGVGTTDPVVGKEIKAMAVPTIQEYRDLLAEADKETNRISDRITELMSGIVPGLSEADANEIKAGLQAEVDKLKGVGVVPTP